MLIVVEIAQNGTYLKNIFLPFYKADHLILGDQMLTFSMYSVEFILNNF